jgi:hypothetical protein
MKRRTLVQALFVGMIAPSLARAEKKTQIDVFKTSSCGCCVEWISHLEQNGFEVIAHNVPKTGPYRLRFGVPPDMASCHTAMVDGYALEGHVPAQEIRRLLAERPKGIGLAVPGMPVGSPGMEVEGTRRDAFDVILFGEDGSRKIFQHYDARS